MFRSLRKRNRQSRNRAIRQSMLRRCDVQSLETRQMMAGDVGDVGPAPAAPNPPAEIRLEINLDDSFDASANTHVPVDGPATQISQGAQQKIAAAGDGVKIPSLDELIDQVGVNLPGYHYDPIDGVYRWNSTGQVYEFGTQNSNCFGSVDDPNIAHTRMQTQQPSNVDPGRNAVNIAPGEVDLNGGRGVSSLDEATSGLKGQKSVAAGAALGLLGDAYIIYTGVNNFDINEDQYGIWYAYSQCAPVADDLGNTCAVVHTFCTTDWFALSLDDLADGAMEAPVIAVPVIAIEVADEVFFDPDFDTEAAFQEGFIDAFDSLAPGAIDTIGDTLLEYDAVESAVDVILSDPEDLRDAIWQALTDPDIDIEAACQEGLAEVGNSLAEAGADAVEAVDNAATTVVEEVKETASAVHQAATDPDIDVEDACRQGLVDAITSVPGGTTLIEGVGGAIGRTSFGRFITSLVG